MWGTILRFLAGWGASKALDELFDKITHVNIGGEMSIVSMIDGGGGGGGGSTTWSGGSYSYGPNGAVKKKRRRRARLTQSELTELMQIKNLLGKTAAAQVLPYYMGRGR